MKNGYVKARKTWRETVPGYSHMNIEEDKLELCVEGDYSKCPRWFGVGRALTAVSS